jgi:hypothetical protein
MIIPLLVPLNSIIKLWCAVLLGFGISAPLAARLFECSLVSSQLASSLSLLNELAVEFKFKFKQRNPPRLGSTSKLGRARAESGPRSESRVSGLRSSAELRTGWRQTQPKVMPLGNEPCPSHLFHFCLWERETDRGEAGCCWRQQRRRSKVRGKGGQLKSVMSRDVIFTCSL